MKIMKGIAWIASITVVISSGAQTPAWNGPAYPPPGGVTLTASGASNDGSIGRNTGELWSFSNMALADQATVYWGVTNGGVKLSFDNAGYSRPGETLAFSLLLSDLQNGRLVWTGETRTPTYPDTPVYTRFTLQASSGALGVNLTDPAELSLSAYLGGLTPVPSSSYSWQALLKFEASYSQDSGFIPALDFYDANDPVTDSTAFSSFSAGFFYRNNPPQISGVPDQFTQIATPVGPLSFTVSDAETPAASLTVTKATDNSTLVPLSNIIIGGSGAGRSVTIYPSPGQYGIANITLTVTDGGGATNSVTFRVMVNGMPTISGIPNQSAQEDTVIGPVSITIGDPETAATNLMLSATSSNPGLMPSANISFGGAGSNRTVTLTPSAGQSGAATVTITVDDGQGATTSSSFELRVNAPPKFTTNQGITVNQGGAGTITLANLNATDDFSGPSGIIFTVIGNESDGAPAQGSLYKNEIALVNSNSFTLADVAANLITYRHNGNWETNDSFQFTITDADGAVAHDGAHTSFTFRITILPVDHPPIAFNQNIGIALGGAYSGMLEATNPDCVAQPLTFTIASNGSKGTAIITNALTGGFTYSARPGESGTDTFTFQVSDGVQLAATAGVVSVSISVVPPVANNSSIAATENAPVSGALSAYDPNLPAQPLIFSILTNGSKGNVVITNAATGGFIYTPDPGRFGTDSFVFKASNGSLESTGTISVSIRPGATHGNLLVADGGAMALIAVNPATGDQGMLSVGDHLAAPRGVVMETSGSVLVVDASNGLIRINPVDGSQTVLASGFAFATSIALEPSGTILVTDGTNGVKRLDRSGAVLAAFSGGNITFAAGVAVGWDGSIYVADAAGYVGKPSNTGIVKVDPITGAQSIISRGGSLALPIGIAVENSGNLIEADAGSMISPSLPSFIQRIAFSDGTQSLVSNGGNLSTPTGVALASNGDIYTANMANASVVKSDSSNGVQTVVASGGLLRRPFGVAFANRPPNPGLFATGAAQGDSISIQAAEIVAIAADPDNDGLSLVSVSANSTNGGYVMLAGDMITYNPQPGFSGIDQFTCLLRDSWGGLTSFAVIVNSSPLFNMLKITSGENGPITLQYVGIPTRQYVAQYATNLTGSPWFNLSTNTIGSDGIWTLVDPSGPDPMRFYRIQQ